LLFSKCKIAAFKNEAVFCEIQCHVQKFLACKFCRKSSGRNFRFMCPKAKLFVVKFRRMLEVLDLQVLQKKFWAQFSVYASKHKFVYREIQTHVRSFRPASFAEKVLGAYLRFMFPNTKLFAVKFRRIFEVLRLQGSQNKFWAHIYDLFVQKRSCLP